MVNHYTSMANSLARQQSIRDKCFHPTGTFVEFKKEEIEQSMPARFEEQVRKYTDRPAIKTKSHELTYGDLNKAANRVAHAILAQGGETAKPVALLIENGAPAVVAVLGILKAGRFYVALDLSYSPQESNQMRVLEDSQTSLIITDNKNLPLANNLVRSGLQLINIDTVDASLPIENPALSIAPDSLACILYTSGSTGRPKGVIQNHRNVLHFVRSFTNGAHVCQQDRLTLLRSVGSSGGMRDTFCSLLNGAALYPFDVNEEGITNLRNWLIDEELTIYRSMTSLFRHLISNLSGDEEFPHLRVVRLGGTSVYRTDVESWKRYFSKDCILYLGLGATEGGDISVYVIDNESEITQTIIPLGYAVEDKEIVLIDDAGRQAASGAIGEITVKSHFLSMGYWQNPELTAATFLYDPAEGGRKILRTGDIGRFLPDGSLEYLGRKSFQMEAQGHHLGRSEMAEIEFALLGLDGVKQAVVIIREDSFGAKHLVAYLVIDQQQKHNESELKSSLRETLPDYMIPSSFEIVDDVPPVGYMVTH